jgi:hypothetical protein
MGQQFNASPGKLTLAIDIVPPNFETVVNSVYTN